MIIRSALALAAFVSTAAAPTAAPPLSENFERGGGVVAKALLKDKRLVIARGEGINGGDALRATYVGGPMGSERLVRHLPLGGSGTEYTLSYQVKFDADFQFVGGGKLHGLGPDRPVTGGDPLRPDGWSARVMWRQEGRPELYTYHQGQKGKYGDHGTVVTPMTFASGRWYAIALHVRLNTPAAEANGLVRLYVDGKLAETHEQLRLRGTDAQDTLISAFLFSTFHGGNDPSWAPKAADGSYADVHALFDDIAVTPGEPAFATGG